MRWNRIALPKRVYPGVARVSEDGSFVIRRANREIYVVTDGHGGRSANRVKRKFARTAAKWIAREIDKEPAVQAFPDHFQRVSDRLDEAFDARRIGAVCSATLITEDYVTVAWIGDVTVATGGFGLNPEQLTEEHTVMHPGERERLRSLFDAAEFGAFATDTWHVGYNGPNEERSDLRLAKLKNGFMEHNIAITRSFGDKTYRPAMIAHPDILVRSREAFPEGSVLAIYSDGAIRRMNVLLDQIRRERFSIEQMCDWYMRSPPRRDDTEILFIQL